MAKKAKQPPASAFVLDGSVALAWCFPDEAAPYPQSVLDALARAQAVVPSLWTLEVANVWLVSERRKRCTHSDIAHWASFLEALPIVVDDETTSRAWADTLSLARAQNLSVYDATYLELALRRKLPIATLDSKLKRAAEAVGISEFAS
jgi:predicted nucleic acid-binding protein